MYMGMTILSYRNIGRCSWSIRRWFCKVAPHLPMMRGTIYATINTCKHICINAQMHANNCPYMQTTVHTCMQTTVHTCMNLTKKTMLRTISILYWHCLFDLGAIPVVNGILEYSRCLRFRFPGRRNGHMEAHLYTYATASMNT